MDGMILESWPLMEWEEEGIPSKQLIVSVIQSESPEEEIKIILILVFLKMKSENS